VIRAQQLPHRKRPFIIALTANVTDEFRTKCLHAGMDLFRVRPHGDTHTRSVCSGQRMQQARGCVAVCWLLTCCASVCVPRASDKASALGGAAGSTAASARCSAERWQWLGQPTRTSAGQQHRCHPIAAAIAAALFARILLFVSLRT
jgi:CheY-like chemotaxis protein